MIQDFFEGIHSDFPLSDFGMAILAGGNVGTHLQMGIGDGVIPAILNQKIYDDIVIVTDEEAVKTAKELR